jgi:hypothetical protein
MFRVMHDVVYKIHISHARPKIQKNDVLIALSAFSGQTLGKLNGKFISTQVLPQQHHGFYQGALKSHILGAQRVKLL